MAVKHRKLEIVSGNKEEHKAYAGKSFSPHHIVSLEPKTEPQRQFIRSYNNETPIIMQLGSAGTGKTFMALYAAISSALDKGTVFDKVAIFRSAVQLRDMGFTPGDADEKGAEYEDPYHALFDSIMTFKSKNYVNLKAKNIVEFHSTSFQRGTTYDDTVLVVDECQSLNFHELCTILTRVGINSRIIFCGDFKQNDLIKKKNDTSGLGEFLRILEEMPSEMVDIITYRPEDVVRSGIVKEFLLAQERLDL